MAVVVLLALAVRSHVFRRHQASVVAKRLKLATEMMRADAGLHADQARRQVGQPRFHLAARPLLPQHDLATLVLPYDVERFLPISMPTSATALLSSCDMACSLTWLPPTSFARWRGWSTAGPSH